jgi:hypothetical protein
MLRSAWLFNPSCAVQPPPPTTPARKQPFTEAEDDLIRDFVRANGAKNWHYIASRLENRTPKQCRERWHNHLDPSIHKGPWSADEDQILAEKQIILGNKWAEIARCLPGRTEGLVKNRWNASVKGRVAIDIAGHIVVLPIAHERLFTIECDQPAIEPGSVARWLGDFNEKSASFVHSLWRDWVPLILKP